MSKLALNQFVGVAPLVAHSSQAYPYMKIMEEACEVAQQAAKIISFGVNCRNPNYAGGRSNIELLEIELGQLLAWVKICGELNQVSVEKATLDKLDTYREWTCE